MIVHDEIGVIADQFYAERLYTRESIGKLLEKTGFRNIRHHGNAETLSDRDQDLGMMARRLLLTADAPQLSSRKIKGKVQQLEVTVRDGRPAPSRRGEARRHVQPRGPRHHPAAAGTRSPSCPDYKFRYLDNHATLERDLSELRTDLVFNLCDEGFNNDPFKELHVPAMLEALEHPLYRRRPAGARRLLRQGPRARRRHDARRAGAARDATCARATRARRCRGVFPAILKPNYGDSSQGITKDAVVKNEKALLDYLEQAARRRSPSGRSWCRSI